MYSLSSLSIKSIKRTGSVCVFLIISICFVQAQADSLLGKFSLSESNGQVALSWQILSGNTCNGIQIYRSTDNVNFTRIGYIAGICGSIYEAVNYFFTDTTPVLNTINYYYLELGGVGTTQVLAIEIIDKNQDGYQIRPHPFQNSGTIYFNAESGKDYILRIYDLLGKEIFSSETSDDHFNVITEFITGQYVFTIASSGDAPTITGKLIVQP